MLHVLIDSCVYRADRKRNKPAFRALTRLARAGLLQLPMPEYVKGEVLSQQQRDVRDQIGKMKAAAEALLGTTGAANMSAKAEEVVKLATDMGTQAEDSVKTELQSWIAEVKASENRRLISHTSPNTGAVHPLASAPRTPHHHAAAML